MEKINNKEKIDTAKKMEQQEKQLQAEECPPRQERERRYFQDAHLWKMLLEFQRMCV